LRFPSDLRHRKTRVVGLPRGVKFFMIGSAVLTQYQRDRHRRTPDDGNSPLTVSRGQKSAASLEKLSDHTACKDMHSKNDAYHVNSI